jgi:hypothetical protein
MMGSRDGIGQTRDHDGAPVRRIRVPVGSVAVTVVAVVVCLVVGATLGGRHRAEAVTAPPLDRRGTGP